MKWIHISVVLYLSNSYWSSSKHHWILEGGRDLWCDSPAHAGPPRHSCPQVSLCWASQLPGFVGIPLKVNPAPLRKVLRKDCWVSDPMPSSLLGQDGVQYNPTKTSFWPVFVLQELWLLLMLSDTQVAIVNKAWLKLYSLHDISRKIALNE